MDAAERLGATMAIFDMPIRSDARGAPDALSPGDPAAPSAPQAVEVSDYTAILSGNSWWGPDNLGKPVFLTFSFEQSVPSYIDLIGNGFTPAFAASFAAFSEAGKSAARTALDKWAQISGVTMLEAPSGQGDLRFMSFDFAKDPDETNVLGFAYYPNVEIDDQVGFEDEYSGDIYIDIGSTTNVHVLAHEIGHALGFKHPFDGDPTLPTNLDNTAHTIMSYTGPRNGVLGPFDIDAVHYVYGGPSADGTQAASWGWDSSTFTLTQIGGASADVMRGVGAADVINGAGGADILAGMSGADTLNGGDGDDRLFGGPGADTLIGGLGNDDIEGGTGYSETANIGDTVDYSAAVQPINVDLNGLAGMPSPVVPGQLTSATGADIGNDFLFLVPRVIGGSGNDTIRGDSRDNTLIGGAGDDILDGRGGNDILYGGSGADSLSGGAGIDTFSGTTTEWDNDTITDFALGEKVVFNGLGVGFTLRFGFNNGLQFLIAAPTGYNGVVNLGNSIANSNAVALAGPSGVAFSLVAIAASTSGHDFYDGDAFDNFYAGGGGDDDILGNEGNDALRGDAGNDLLFGSLGDDVLQGGAGDDTMDGYIGTDIASYDDAPGSVSVSLAIAGPQNTGAGGTDTLIRIDGISGSQFNDTLIGDDGANILRGQGGNDAFFSGAGDDIIDGGLGSDGAILGDGNDVADLGNADDYAYAGAGNDVLYGGAGTDILLGEDGADVIFGGVDQDYLFGQAGDDILQGEDGVDVVIGDIGNDVLLGGAGNDYLYAGAGADSALGGAGADLFVMEDGADTVNGEDGNDFVYAGDGDDLILGGPGTDILLGEAGNDVIDPGPGVDYVFLGTGADTLKITADVSGVSVLYDFTPGGTGDHLQLLGTGWSNVTQVQAATADTGNGYSILTIDADTAIWMIGVAPGQLTAADILFA